MMDMIKDMMNLFAPYELDKDDKAAVEKWLAEFWTANDMTGNEMLYFVQHNTGWIMDEVFPSDDE